MSNTADNSRLVQALLFTHHFVLPSEQIRAIIAQNRS